jgi:hypothetical protein
MSKNKAHPSTPTKEEEIPRPAIKETAPEAPESDTPVATIKPSKQKIGEGTGNLHRRQEWFQKRSGKG